MYKRTALKKQHLKNIINSFTLTYEYSFGKVEQQLDGECKKYNMISFMRL
jgi:hypothetical protein